MNVRLRPALRREFEVSDKMPPVSVGRILHILQRMLLTLHLMRHQKHNLRYLFVLLHGPPIILAGLSDAVSIIPSISAIINKSPTDVNTTYFSCKCAHSSFQVTPLANSLASHCPHANSFFHPLLRQSFTLLITHADSDSLTASTYFLVASLYEGPDLSLSLCLKLEQQDLSNACISEM